MVKVNEGYIYLTIRHFIYILDKFQAVRTLLSRASYSRFSALQKVHILSDVILRITHVELLFKTAENSPLLARPCFVVLLTLNDGGEQPHARNKGSIEVRGMV